MPGLDELFVVSTSSSSSSEGLVRIRTLLAVGLLVTVGPSGWSLSLVYLHNPPSNPLTKPMHDAAVCTDLETWTFDGDGDNVFVIN